MSLTQAFSQFRSGYNDSHPTARKLWLLSLLLLPLIHLSLYCFGLRKVQTTLFKRRSHKVALTPRQSIAPVLRAKRATYLSSQWPLFSGSCLSRSLLLCWFLHRQGIESELRIGVRHRDGKFEAHAWIEYNGVPLNANMNVHAEYSVFNERINLAHVRFM